MKKWVKNLIIVGSIFTLVGITWGILSALPRQQAFNGDNPMMKEDEVLPLLIAHGGGNKEFPDNTLEAFYNAYSVDENVMMETDVSITKDGVIILSHDITLDRKTNVTGLISDWNYTDLIEQKVDFGYTNPTERDENNNPSLSGERVVFKTDEGIEVKPKDVELPTSVQDENGGIKGRDSEVYLATTLEELITHFPSNRINVEIKQSGEIGLRAFNEVLSLLEEHDAFDRVVLASFHEEIFSQFKEYQETNPSFMYSPATMGVVKFVILHFLSLDYFYFDKVTVFQVPMEQAGIQVATKGIVDRLHAHNIAVHYWTIDDKEDMKYLIDIGCDGIMTNYPHRLKEVYDSYEK